MSSIQSIQTHIRTYRSALESTRPITINSLINYYTKTSPILHPHINNPKRISIPTLIYSLLRLPKEIDQTKLIVVGQTPEVFKENDINTVTKWPKVTAISRYRTMHFNKKTKTLACFATSISDIDDLTNLLISFQIEWNKFHKILKTFNFSQKSSHSKINFPKLLSIPPKDWQSLKTALGPKWKLRLNRIAQTPTSFQLHLLAGSWINYSKATQRWWKNIAITTDPKFHISRQNIYFVSSNTHSLINLITGAPLKYKSFILKHLKQNIPNLFQTWQQIQNNDSKIHPNDFLYFSSQFLPKNSQYHQNTQKLTQKLGIITIPASHYLNITTQLIPIKSLAKSKYLDPRLQISTSNPVIQSSSDLIFNINYPLGFAAYHILNETLENANKIKGIYIIGKAALLNGEIGDIQIPRLVFDEHTQNSYLINNCFEKFFPFINKQGSILTKQKAVSVLGTYLENKALLEKYSKNNLTVIEMESGPYLGAITEATYNKPAPKNTVVDLNNPPFDLGIINYTSDTPYSKAKNLGSLGLNLKGIEPVYLASLTVLQRIINQEQQPS
ncbi:hypothetical protein KKE45_00780 [Patescibacteria group bacterium]|nr:hypothetical protein [Patescibacteria group bacterium]